MTTLIICPACQTRYEVKAAFPPEGRKVRCSKCGHVWQAKPAGAEALAPVSEPASAPQPAPAPRAKPAPQAPAPEAAPPPPPPPPQAAPSEPMPPPPPPPKAAPPPPPPQAAPPPPPPELPGMPPALQGDADFDTEDELAAQVARMNAEAMPPPPPPEPEPVKQGGLFSRIMGKKKGAAPAQPEAAPPPPPEMAPPQAEASFGEPAPQDASFDISEEEQEAALADPDLVAAAFGEAPPKKAKAARKPLPVVAIGWSVLAVLVAIVLSLFIFAPNTTVSILPGASRIYGMLGVPVGAQGLAFEGVRYGWTNDGSQTVLEVQGNVRNTSSSTMTVPTVVIALRDENGQEISEWTTEVGAAELEAGEEAPFLRQIPSPPSNVRSLKVRFAEAD